MMLRDLKTIVFSIFLKRLKHKYRRQSQWRRITKEEKHNYLQLIKHSSLRRRVLVASFLLGFFVTTSAILIKNYRNYAASHDQTALTNSQFEGDVLSASEEKSSSQIADNLTVPNDLKTLGVLLLGYGGAGHEGGYLTDAIEIVFFDFEKRKIALVSIPRDLWVKLSDGRESKINSVFQSTVKKNDSEKKKAESFKNTVSDITGLKIDYFAAVDFVGFQRAIGINLKGIDVEVFQTLDDPWYPISGEELNTCGLSDKEVAEVSQEYSGFELEKLFPCRYEHLHFEKGIIHMEGGDALKYVRSRHGSAEGDVSRGRRTQEALTAIAKKLFSLNAPDDIPGFYENLVKHVSTDIDLESAKYIGPLLKLFRDIEIVNINLSTTNVLSSTNSNSGQAILIPKEGIGKWDKVHLFIKGEIEKN